MVSYSYEYLRYGTSAFELFIFLSASEQIRLTNLFSRPAEYVAHVRIKICFAISLTVELLL